MPSFYAAFEDRGLKFLCRGKGQWEATGWFDLALHFAQYAASMSLKPTRLCEGRRVYSFHEPRRVSI
jgi:hypothetical protein